MKISDKQFRVSAYLPDSDDEAFLTQLNETLAEIPASNKKPSQPLLFVGGSPRAGTTLMAQSVAQFVECDYVDNLAARFWLAPATGLRLSRLVFRKQKRSDFRSDFGATRGSDIHSFHYFWMHHLHLSDAKDLFSDPSTRKVDWDRIAAHLAEMQAVSRLPLVLRGYYPLYFMAEFKRHLPTSVFIIVRRNHVEQAVSILDARKKVLRDNSDWWSMHPPNSDKLAKLPIVSQVVGQILGLERYFDGQNAREELPVVFVSFEDLRRDPAATMNRLVDDIRKKTGFEVKLTGRLPEINEERRHHPSAKALEEIEAAFANFRA